MSGQSRSITLVLGGQRSGKSEYAEGLAPKLASTGIYLATTDATGAKDDAEFQHRIRRHRDRRGAFWRTIEEPLDLPGVLAAEAQPGQVVLVECLTLWLSNLLAREFDIEPEVARLLRGLEAVAGHVILVSNEVGLGIVPANALARRFADLAGDLHQAIARSADRVVLVAAGLPLLLKGNLEV
jgi:adenosylcobinamide kinase/adenosylcobinamide-phosphate guanylyltransferase